LQRSRAAGYLAGMSDKLGELSRTNIVREVWAATDGEDDLVLGASRMIREADAMAPAKAIRIHANRGLAGIDGTIATANGKISKVDYEALGYGHYVDIKHNYGFSTRYGHLSRSYVTKGQDVVRGQVIAALGASGLATGPHLHFELKVDGVQRNPLPVLNDEEEIPAEMATFNELIGTGTPR
jgi:hypothetical protein